MMKKTIFILAALLIILTFASMTVLAQPGPAKGGKPTATPPPDTPPIPTEIPDEGTLYGDLYVILRDVNGVPIMAEETITVPESEEGPEYDVIVKCIQPIAKIDDDLEVPLYTDEDSIGWYVDVDVPPLNTTIRIYEGEPFSPVSYVDEAGDLVECELSLYTDPNNTPTDPTDDVEVYDLTPFVQSVDFGRLNLGRAPDAVINHAFDEAVNKFNNACDMTLDPAGRIMYYLPDEDYDGDVPCIWDDDDQSYVPGEWLTIDSPAENLALYIKMLIDGHWITLDTSPTEHIGGKGSGGGGGGPPAGDGPSTEPRPLLNASARYLITLVDSGYSNLVPDYTLDENGDPVFTNEPTVDDLGSEDFLLAASLLAGAGDKTGNYTIDKVIYINAIYGITNWSGANEEEYPTSFLLGGYQYQNAEGNLGRSDVYDARGSVECLSSHGLSFMWVLTTDDHETFVADCVIINGIEGVPTVHFTDFVEVYKTATTLPYLPYTFSFTENIRGFAQAADDALQVLEYIHNYRVPADLYGEDT